MELPLQVWIEKTVHVVKAYWLSGKKKFLGAVVIKEGPADSPLGLKVTRSALYWPFLR